MTVAAMSGVPFTLQDTKATGNGEVIAPPSSFKNHNFTIKGATGVSAGAIQVEVSNDPSEAGTWSPLTASPTTVVADANILVAYTGLIMFARARISTTISGGGAPSVTVTYEGAKSY